MVEEGKNKMKVVEEKGTIQIGIYWGVVEVVEENGLYDCIIRIPVIREETAKHIAEQIVQNKESFEKIPIQ